MKLDTIVEMIPDVSLDEAIRLIELKKSGKCGCGKASVSCPHCGSQHVIRHGRDSKGRQRYRCICGKTFTERTGTPFSHLRIGKPIVKRFLDMEFSGMTLS